jgi:hypothetical protein
MKTYQSERSRFFFKRVSKLNALNTNTNECIHEDLGITYSLEKVVTDNVSITESKVKGRALCIPTKVKISDRTIKTK